MVDKELEKRGLRFVRYADDFLIVVASGPATGSNGVNREPEFGCYSTSVFHATKPSLSVVAVEAIGTCLNAAACKARSATST